MKTIGTVINTIVVVFGMLCSLVAGTFVGYCLAVEDERPGIMRHRQYTSYTNAYEYNRGYSKGYCAGWNSRKETYDNNKEETEENEDIGEA